MSFIKQKKIGSTYLKPQNNKRLFCIILFFYCFSTVSTIQATHIVGGELNYKCLGNNNYEISLTVFRDCENGIPFFDNPASVGIFDSLGQIIQHVQINFNDDDTLQPVLFDSCLVIPPNVCVHRTTYIDTIFLPFLQGGYQLAYQRCCRNYTIGNIITPNNTGATFYTFISTEALSSCNSNPVFREWPPIYICVNTPITFDHSALDIDGDSLVYELCAPFDGASLGNPQPQPPNPPPYDSVNWATPYNTFNMLGGTPLHINRQTGFMTGTPTAVGQFVVGICVKEYRNGQLISETKRDFQYNIGECGRESLSSFFAPDVQCDGFTVNFDNQSLGDTYYWDFGDPNTTGDTSNAYDVSYTYPDTGLYTVNLITGRETTCADTFSKTIGVYEKSIIWGMELDYDPCESPTKVHFTDISTDSLSTITEWFWWSIAGGDSAFTSVGTLTLSGADNGVYDIRMMVTNEFGCSSANADVIQVDPIDIDVSIDSQACRGQSFALRASNLDDRDTITFRWSPESEIISGTNDSIALVAPIYPTSYFLTATATNGCIFLDTITIDSFPNEPPLQTTAIPDSIYPGQASQLAATFNMDYNYYWKENETLSDTLIADPLATPLETSTYTLTIDSLGCLNFDTVTVYIKNFECEERFVFVPNAFTPNDDGKNDKLFVRSYVTDEIHFAVYNRWGQQVFETRDVNVGWDGTFGGQQLAPDVFAYFLQVRCVNGATYSKKGNVTLLR